MPAVSPTSILDSTRRMMSDASSIGKQIIAARASFASRVGLEGSRTKLSQQALYKRCQDVEVHLRGSAPPLFPECNERVADRKIRAFEKGNVRPTPHHLRILERALGMGEGTFEPQPSDGPPTDNARRTREPNLSGFRSIPRNDVITDETRRVMHCIDQALEIRVDDPSVRVACIAAPPGYGKSFIIAQWWYSKGVKTNYDGVLALDCAKMPGDQIIREIGSYFCGREIEALDDGLIEAIRSTGLSLFIFDGLSTERPKGANLPTTSDTETLRTLKELVGLLVRRRVPCRVLLGIQTPYASKPALTTSQIFVNADVVTEEVRRLSPADGAQMFKALNVDGVSEADLRRLSAQLSGLPLAIEAVARLLVETRQSGDMGKLERLVALGEHDAFGDQIPESFFARIMRDADLYANPDSHPEAFIRLLALFPGQISRRIIEMLLEKEKISRLNRASIERFSGDRIPFVTEVNNSFSLHPLVKQHVRADLDAICWGRRYDAHTSMHEIQWIHAAMAVYNLSRLKSDPSDIESMEIGFIEGALHHLIALRDLCSSASIVSDDKVFLDLQNLMGKAIDERAVEIDAKSITRFCFRAIAVPYFFERTFRMTRFLGHYETKARLLGFFEGGSGRGRSVDHLSALEGSRIFTEIAVSWMHSGRLELAGHAAVQGRNLLSGTGLTSISAGELTDRARGEGRADEWIQFASLCSIQTAILLRQGRDLDTVADKLGAAARVADEILALCDETDLTTFGSLHAVIRAAKNVVSRQAYARYLAGDLAASCEMFGTAAYIEARLNRSFLSGEAARRYAEVLIRSKRDNSLAAAREIVRANLDTGAVGRTKTQLVSNDIISMKILDAALDRIAGDIATADGKISAVADHTFVRMGEAPYAARQELMLEGFRIRIARGEKGTTLQEDLQAFIIEMRNRHHFMFAYQAQLLYAETNPPDRENFLQSLRYEFRTIGWNLFEADVDLLRSGGSIVLDRGL